MAAAKDKCGTRGAEVPYHKVTYIEHLSTEPGQRLAQVVKDPKLQQQHPLMGVWPLWLIGMVHSLCNAVGANGSTCACTGPVHPCHCAGIVSLGCLPLQSFPSLRLAWKLAWWAAQCFAPEVRLSMMLPCPSLGPLVGSLGELHCFDCHKGGRHPVADCAWSLNNALGRP